MTRVLFVCLGNICRSPTAEGLLRARVEEARREGRLRGIVEVDSAGILDVNVGRPPALETQHVARARGLDLSGLRARQVQGTDFDEFDLVVAMDHANLRELRSMCPKGLRGRVRLLSEFAGGDWDVPDPYGGPYVDYEEAWARIERGVGALLDHLARGDALSSPA